MVAELAASQREQAVVSHSLQEELQDRIECRVQRIENLAAVVLAAAATHQRGRGRDPDCSDARDGPQGATSPDAASHCTHRVGTAGAWQLPAPVPAPQRRAAEQMPGPPPAHPPAQPEPEVNVQSVWEEPAMLSLEI